MDKIVAEKVEQQRREFKTGKYNKEVKRLKAAIVEAEGKFSGDAGYQKAKDEFDKADLLLVLNQRVVTILVFIALPTMEQETQNRPLIPLMWMLIMLQVWDQQKI